MQTMKWGSKERKADGHGRRRAAASPLEAGVHSFGAASSLKQFLSSLTRPGLAEVRKRTNALTEIG